MKTCIYTAIFGNYTTLKEPREPDPETRLICFTDNKALQRAQTNWDVRVIPRTPFAHPRMAAKWYRMNPDILLREYDSTIWVDGSFHLGDIGEFKAMCLNALEDGNNAFALFSHPESQGIAQEAAASFRYWSEKYRSEPLLEQIQSYFDEGFKDRGMWATGIMIRSNREDWVREMNRLWMAECIKWSYQDQLSLPYVLWMLGKNPNIIPGNIYRGPHHLWEKGEDR